ncbi:MAG TPA: CdaR family protein [Thermoanaerobaculia bacterium]
MNDQWRTWALRLLALGIAIGIWFNASVEDRLVSSEKVVEAGITYNRPRGFIVINPVQNVQVRLIGSKKAVRQLNPDLVDIQVDLSRQQAGSATINLGPENVLAPDGLAVVSVEPSAIRVELEREVTQRLPVVPKLVGVPAAGVIAEKPEVFPNQVLVTGPEPLLARIDSLSTRPISLEGRVLTFEETVPVLTPDPLIQIVQPSKVTVRVPLQASGDQAKDAARPRKERT